MSANDQPDNSTLILKELDVPGRTGPVSEGSPKVWGLNIAAVKDNFPRQGLLCRAGPWATMSRGDKLVIYRDLNQQLLQEIVDADEVDKELAIFVPSALVQEGRSKLSYAVTRFGQTAESSEVMEVLVKLSRPGGDDTEGPGHPKLIMTFPKEILEGGIDKDNVAAGVDITIGPSADGPQPYPNAAAGDVIQVTWGGVYVLSAPLTQDQADGKVPIVVHITEDDIREAGDSDAAGLAVAFEVYDVVDNRSEDWSVEQRVVVAIDADRLEAALLKEALNNVLDVDKLGDADGTAQILAVDTRKFKVGDIPIVRVKGTPVEGPPIDLEITGDPLVSVPSIPEVKISNAVLRQLAKAQLALSYRLQKADSSDDLRAKTQFVSVIGEVQRLVAPKAVEAQQGALDPELAQVRIEIPFDTSFAAGQAIKLFWLGTRPDLTPYLPDLPLRPITQGDYDAGLPLQITVDGKHLIPIDGGKLELYYQLLIEDAVLRTMNRVNATHAIRESIHADMLRVGEPRLELPEPKVTGVVNGVLPPDTTGTTLTVEYLNTVSGDEVFRQWNGSKTGPDEDSVELTSFTAGKAVPFTIKAELIKGNEGGTVTAQYYIKRAAGGTSYSNPLEIAIGQQESVRLDLAGNRSQTGPHYHSNLSRLIASASMVEVAGSVGEILWTYAGDTQGVTGESFLDTAPERSLVVTVQQGENTLARKVLRSSNVIGVFNLNGRHSICITKDDGSVFGWSDNNEMLPPAGLKDVQYVTAGGEAYAALKKDNTVVAWGKSSHGGTIAPEIAIQLKNVKKLAATAGAFVALRDDGVLVTWGHRDFGGVIPGSSVSQLSPATHIIGNTVDFSVLLRDGRVFSWGGTWPDGQWVSGASGATQLCASDRAFCALKTDGSIFPWGASTHGGTLPDNAPAEVRFLASTSAAFAALKADGSVTAWGNQRFGGEGPGDLQAVTHLTGSTTAFCGLKGDGSLVAWGEPGEGGRVPSGLGPALSISASYGSFAAVLNNHLAVSWGVNTSSPSLTPVACAYAAGPHLVLLSPDSNLQSVGPNAPDLEALSGLVSYTE